MLTIYDAVAWDTMPKRVPILVYVDPPPAINTEDAIAGLEPSMTFTVTALGNVTADIADVESGDMSPGRAAFGVRMGWWHTVYCSLDTFPSVVSAMKAQGSPQWSWFAADPTGTPHLPPGASACQYAWHSLGQCPANYDMSCALESWVQKVHAPPTQTPTLEGATEMDSLIAPNGDIVSHYRTPQNHLLEVTRKASTQGQPINPSGQPENLSIEDITARYPQFEVVG